MKARFVSYRSCLGSIENVDHFGFELARLARERQAKAWLKGMDRLPAAKVEQLDRKKLAELDEEQREAEGRLGETLGRVSVEVAKLIAAR